MGYAFFAFATLADGHGTFLFAAMFIAWILFAIGVILIPFSHSKLAFLIIVSSVVVYYPVSGVIVIVEQTGEGNFERTLSFLHRHPVIFLSTAVWYVSGQIAFWYLLIERAKRWNAP